MPEPFKVGCGTCRHYRLINVTPEWRARACQAPGSFLQGVLTFPEEICNKWELLGAPEVPDA